MSRHSLNLPSLRPRARSFAVWLLAGALLVVSALSASACRSVPEHRAYAEQYRDDNGGDSQQLQAANQRIEEITQRKSQLEGRIGEIDAELDRERRRLATETERVEVLRDSIDTLESERDELREESEMLRQQNARLRERTGERTLAPIVREPLQPYEYYTGDRPALRGGYLRVDEGGFGFDYPEDWSLAVKPTLERTEFVLTSPDGRTTLTIRMWPYPRWSGQREIASTLHDWYVDRVTEVRGTGRLAPDADRTAPLVAGLPTIVGEYNYVTEEEIAKRHRRARINLIEADERYRSFDIDIIYEATDEDAVAETVATWETVLGSFWLPGPTQ